VKRPEETPGLRHFSQRRAETVIILFRTRISHPGQEYPSPTGFTGFPPLYSPLFSLFLTEEEQKGLIFSSPPWAYTGGNSLFRHILDILDINSVDQQFAPPDVPPLGETGGNRQKGNTRKGAERERN